MRKKILASILAGVFIINSIVPVSVNTVYAQEAVWEQESNVVKTDEITYINPLYEGIISEDDLISVPESGIAVFAEPVYETDDSVIAGQIRQSMINREGTIHIYYQSEQEYDENWSKQLLEKWFQMALDDTADPRGGDYLRWTCGGYRAQCAYGGGKFDCTLTVTYYTTAGQEQELDNRLSSVLSGLGVKSLELSDYEKIKKIYDYICSHVTYDYSHLENNSYTLQFTAYAALINGTAVCQGYANLLYRMLKEVGIDTRIVTGTGNGGAHAWNIVKLGEMYYLVDSTWDASRKDTGYGYFLKGTTDFADHTAESDFINSYNISNVSYDVSGAESHTHEYSKNWESNETEHWRECACGAKTDMAAHVESDWIVDQEATETAEGSRHKECTVCKKMLATETIPKLEQTPIPDVPTVSDAPTSGNPVNDSVNNNSQPPISKIEITGISKKIAAGKKIKLSAVVSPSNASGSIIWNSSNSKVATVNNSGVVAMKKGSAGKSVTITAIAADNSSIKASYKITSMKGAVKSISIFGKKTVKAGKSVKLKAKVKSGKGANKKVVWSSSNPNVAAVSSSGKVVAKPNTKGKKVKITALASDGSGKKKSITLKIK